MSKRFAMTELSPLISEVLENGGEVVLTVTGNSMFPMLHHRMDKVCLVKPPEEPLKEYDIPLFVRKDGIYVLHRIVAVKIEGYVIIGDNQWVKEYPVLHSQVLGLVKGFWRNGKYFSCDDFLYRAYCRFWVLGHPVRRLCLIGKQAFKKWAKGFLCGSHCIGESSPKNKLPDLGDDRGDKYDEG